MELSFIIIDDEELDHYIAKRMIAGYSAVIQTESFQEANLALEHIKAGQFDEKVKIVVILLDIYMPLMDGFQFVEAFEKLQPYIQEKYYLVALTSSVGVTDLNRINAYSSLKKVITKPITADTLAAIIDSALFNIQPLG